MRREKWTKCFFSVCMYLCGCHVLSVPDDATARILLLLLLLPLMLLVVGDDAGANGCRLLLLYCCRRSLITGSQMRKHGKKRLSNIYIHMYLYLKYVCALTMNAVSMKNLSESPISTYIFHFHYSFPFRKPFFKIWERNVSMSVVVVLLLMCGAYFNTHE